MKAFVGLGSKMYSYLTDDGKSKSKAKGVTKATTDRDLLFAEYKKVIVSCRDHGKVKQVRIESHKQQLHNFVSEKESLRCVDDKRYFDDGVHTTPLGYHLNRKPAKA